jgi:hypothetical protein
MPKVDIFPLTNPFYEYQKLTSSLLQTINQSSLWRPKVDIFSVACAILWNFWVLATYLFLLFLSGILQYSYAKGYGRFLEQPPQKLDSPLNITI